MKVQKIIEVWLVKKRLPRPIDVVQGDKGIQLLFKIQDFTIPSGTTATLYVQKPSGKFVYQETGITVSGNNITIDLENQAIIEHGNDVPYQVQLKNGADDVTTFAGIFRVEKSLKDAGAEESKTVIAAFEAKTAEQIAQIEAAAQEQIEQIQNQYNLFATKNEAANAIKGNLSGAVVVADDVSPVEHNPVVKVHGKNLIDTTKIEVQSSDNIYISAVGEGYIEITTVSGYVSNGHRQTFVKLKDLCPQMVANRSYVLNAETESTLEMAHLRDVDYFVYFGKPFVVTEEMLESYLAFYGFDTRNDTTGGTCRISNIQIEEGSVATDYEPYIDPSTVTVRRCGKNIFDINAVTEFFNNNLEPQPESLAKIENGTIISNLGLYGVIIMCNPGITYLPKGKYSLSVDAMSNRTTGNKQVKVVVQFDDDTYTTCINQNLANYGKWERLSGSINLESGKFVKGFAFQGNGESGDYQNLQIHFKNIQLEPEEESAFEPYNGAEYTPAADGTVEGITSLSPNMTILTDTDGVVVECEYIRDSNKVIDELIEKVNADLTDTNAHINELESVIMETETIVYSEQELVSGYMDKHGDVQTSPFHFYFTMPAKGVKSVTVKPLSNRNNKNLYYMVHIAEDGTATPYFELTTLDEETVELGGNLDGTLYFNAFTDETYQDIEYIYIKEATVKRLVNAASETDFSDVKARIDELETAINSGVVTKTIVYSEQELISGYVPKSGVPAVNKNHYYFSMPAYGVKSVTITPLMAGPNGNISYLVFVDKDGKATPYASLRDTEPTTVEFDGATEGTLYFNAYTDETIDGVTYNYVKEATLQCVIGAIPPADTDDDDTSNVAVSAVNNHCVNKPYTFNGKTALFFGDSITYGWTGSAQAENGYPKQFSDKVGMTFTNYGANGKWLSSTIPDIIKSKDLTSDFIFISGGVNDWQNAVTLANFRTGVADLCAYLKENYSGEVIFITPINHAGWNPIETPVAELQEYRDIITELALMNGYSVVQGNLFNFPVKENNADYKTAIFGDKLHPTELGYQLYAKQLATVLC